MPHGQYCNYAAKHFHVYLLGNWIDVDETWQMNGRFRKHNLREYLAESFQWIHIITFAKALGAAFCCCIYCIVTESMRLWSLSVLVFS